MVLKFYSGTNYTGQILTTMTEFLEFIRDSLIEAGWVIELDDIDPNFSLKIKGFDEEQNSPKDECFFHFYKNTNDKPAFKGYLGNDADEESIEREFSAWTEGENNRIWLTADSGAGAFVLFNGGNSLSELFTDYTVCDYSQVSSIFFGFYDRTDMNDEYAWGWGVPYYRVLEEQYVAKAHYNNNNLTTPWLRQEDIVKSNSLSSREWLTYYDLFNSNGQCIQIQGIFDRFSFPHNPSDNYDYNNFSRNPSRQGYYGAKNAVDNKCYLDKFFILELNNDFSGASEEKNTAYKRPCFYRGDIKFIATGMANLLALEQITDTDGKRWMSCHNWGYQGMRIA